MISSLLGRLEAVVIAPQAAVADETLRAVIDDEGGAPDTGGLIEHPQAVIVAGSRTRPVAEVIGGRLLTVQHEVVVVVSVLLAEDDRETKRRRDGIVLDLVLRYRDADLDVDGWRTVGSRWEVDYATLGPVDTRNQYATLTFTVQQERQV